MTATSLDLSQIKTDALSAASTFRTLIGLGTLATQSPTGTPSASNFLRGDFSWQTIDLTGYVPYTGATANLDLGSYTLSAKNATIAGGTVTTSTPVLNLSQTFNNAAVTFSALKLDVTDTASNASSLLLDLQVGGTTRLALRKDGKLFLGPTGSSAPVIFSANGGIGINRSDISTTNSAFFLGYYSNYYTFTAIRDAAIGWSASNSDTSGGNSIPDTALFRDAANTLAQRNGTNSQAFRLYNTYANAGVDYDRLALSFATYSSVLYARLLAESAGTGAANIGLVLGPKGNGAITAQMPDGTTAGGNARGTYAVDLSMSRSNAASVASATYSIVAGGNNNKASAQYAVVSGGATNFATGDYSVISGGTTNNAQAQHSTVCGGNNNYATNNYSTVVGGYASTASGLYAVSGGYINEASATASLAFGGRAIANRYGQFAYGCAGGWTYGNAQMSMFVLNIKTTDATATTLMLDGNATRLTIPSGKVFAFVAKISGIKSDGSAVAFYTRKGAIKNVGGTTSLVGNIETLGTDTEDNVNTDVAITADDTNDALQINVTGIASETWRWVAVVEGVEIGYGT